MILYVETYLTDRQMKCFGRSTVLENDGYFIISISCEPRIHITTDFVFRPKPSHCFCLQFNYLKTNGGDGFPVIEISRTPGPIFM